MTIKIVPADKWFSLCIRERAENKCEICGNPNPQCCHLEGRGNWATRFEPKNCYALCYGHHQYMDGRKVTFREYAVSARGTAVYDEIVRLSLDAMKAKDNRHRQDEIAAHYKSQYEIMLQKRSQGITGWLEFEPWKG